MIKFQHIHHSFTGGISLFNDFSLELPRNRVTIIDGKSGIGKTSLINMVLGFLIPDAGNVTVDGEIVSPETVRKIRRKIAYVPQEAKIGFGNVGRFFEEYLNLADAAEKSLSSDTAHELFDYFELDSENIVTSTLDDLSGGEAQRIALVFSLMLGRSIFILDEPTSSLDAGLKRKTVNRFCSIENVTVVVVSHDPDWLDENHTLIYNFDRKQWTRQ